MRNLKKTESLIYTEEPLTEEETFEHRHVFDFGNAFAISIDSGFKILPFLQEQ